ncbi:LysR family transcriptional regulator [Pectobacterium cacticida]|uniref:LysR family transcriptional regulator n=1 Tax=Pectobacterium cacticida TaxID=69221 RepID=A0ABZ2G9D0_9GAMM|nr:LysR family transcriptional regulator [Pectobacterium cacticida]UYX07481.1 LysR family transcriptional regulator [Pectobacterium cacticida]
MDHIQAMRVFVRIAELGSFSRAAERLALPRATVSNTIKQLEGRLGARLLQRTTRQVQITAEGRIYYERCLQLLAEIEEIDTLFTQQKQQPAGRVRVDMPHSLAREIVIPALGEFYARYPQVTLMLSANDTAINVLREGVDCVLRAWQTDDETLATRHLPSMQQVTCASPDYLARYGMPRSLDQLSGHQMVGYFSLRNEHQYPLEFMSGDACITRMLPSVLQVNGSDAYIAGACAGLGIIQAPWRGLRPFLQSGALVEILPEMPPPAMPLYVMYTPGRFLAPRIRVFIEWLDEIFTRNTKA